MWLALRPNDAIVEFAAFVCISIDGFAGIISTSIKTSAFSSGDC
jgi:hypothetical protein